MIDDNNYETRHPLFDKLAQVVENPSERVISHTITAFMVVAVTLLSAVLVLALGAFIGWQLNPGAWSDVGRFSAVCAWLTIQVFALPAVFVWRS